jgi:hypothetical protein
VKCEFIQGTGQAAFVAGVPAAAFSGLILGHYDCHNARISEFGPAPGGHLAAHKAKRKAERQDLT